jgi:hypothetical protein
MCSTTCDRIKDRKDVRLRLQKNQKNIAAKFWDEGEERGSAIIAILALGGKITRGRFFSVDCVDSRLQ